MSKQNATSFPEKPRLTLQVGVTGHRPSRLPSDSADLKERVAETLQTVALAYREFASSVDAKAAYNAEAPVLRLLSPLAEGADRIAAVCGLAAGYDLQCPLPFLRDVYIEDFTETDEFDELLGKASKVLQLDGERSRKAQAYRNVGHLVLNHSDVVLAIWDGDEDENSPGTPGMVAKARRIGLPIVWINTKEPEKVQFFDPRSPLEDWQDFNKTVFADFLKHSLLPPENTDASSQVGIGATCRQKVCPPPKDCYQAYFPHPEPSTNLLGTLYRGFFALLGKTGKQRWNWVGNPYRQDAEQQWQALANAEESFRCPDALREHFIRSDSLACYYADKYRGTFVACFGLGGLAVLFALLGGPFSGFSESFKSLSPLFAALELSAILAILLLINHGRHQDCHRRWLDYRLLAERLRQAAFLMPIGIVPRWSLPVYESHDDQSHAWIDWLARAVIQADGISGGMIDTEHRQNYCDYLCSIVKGQVEYHHTNAERNERIVHTLHGANLLLLGLIVAACAAHIFHLIHDAETELTIAATVLPAFGATIAGILSQGEFKRIARRSNGMAAHLEKIESCLKRSPPTAEFLVEQANQVIVVMSQELSDWCVIFRIKPLEIHA